MSEINYKLFNNSDEFKLLTKASGRQGSNGQILLQKVRESYDNRMLCVGCSKPDSPVEMHTRKIRTSRTDTGSNWYLTLYNGKNPHKLNCPFFSITNNDSNNSLDERAKTINSLRLVDEYASEKPTATPNESSDVIPKKRGVKVDSFDLMIRQLLNNSYLNSINHSKATSTSLNTKALYMGGKQININGGGGTLSNVMDVGFENINKSLDFVAKWSYKSRPCRFLIFSCDQLIYTEGGFTVTLNGAEINLPKSNKVTRYSQRTSGPFIIVCTVTRDNTDQSNVILDRLWIHPIVHTQFPILVDSHYERLFSVILIKLTASEFIYGWSKPYLAIYENEIKLIPDFIVKSDAGGKLNNFIIEIMGGFGGDDYYKRKDVTIPMMSEAFNMPYLKIDISSNNDLNFKKKDIMQKFKVVISDFIRSL